MSKNIRNRGSRTCGWCEYNKRNKIVGLTVASQTTTMPPLPPRVPESCPYVSHSFRCCAFLINGLLCWGRVASQPFQVDPGRVLVGGGHHDHRRLRGHDVGPSSACWSHDLFFSSVMSQETHTHLHIHTIFLWHCITFSSAFLANNRNAWQLCSTNQTKPNCFQ